MLLLSNRSLAIIRIMLSRARCGSLVFDDVLTIRLKNTLNDIEKDVYDLQPSNSMINFLLLNKEINE